MGPLIIAAVVAHVITKAWEESQTRAAARWESARTAAEERRTAAEARRQAKRKARNRRLRRASVSGPSDPIWWVMAGAWSVAALATGTVAAVAGAREGAAHGARVGYRIGQERAWARVARRRREKAAFRNGREAGREAGRDEAERAHPEWRPAPEDEVAAEQCPHCSAYMATPETCPCPKPAPLTAASETARKRKSASGPMPTGGFYAAYQASHGGASYRPPHWGPAEPDLTTPANVPDDYVIDGEEAFVSDADPGPVVDAEVIYDPNDNQTSTTDTTTAIGRNPEMAQLTSGITGGDGEGYGSTIQALGEIKKLLAELNAHVTDLGDTLTANNVDSVTTGLVSELDDLLQAATNTAEQAGQHAEGQHGEVAHAIAGAGGSGAIANAAWYDHV